jgi:hypothetical protein
MNEKELEEKIKEDLKSYIENHFDMNTPESLHAKELLMNFSKKELEQIDNQIEKSLLFFSQKVLPILKKKNHN